MHAAPARPVAPAPVLSVRQYSELRNELEVELRRLVPDAGPRDESALRDLAPRSRRRALEIVDVLRRMETESFGVCVGCRSPIAYERLAAIPETTLCAPCSRGRELALQG